MRKIITLGLLLTSVFAAGSAFGASVNGTFKGFDIVKVKVNGEEVSGDVPAINFYGRTMVPIQVVSESLGASITWDATERTASITVPTKLTEEQVKEKLISYNGYDVSSKVLNGAKHLIVKYNLSKDPEQNVKNIKSMIETIKLGSYDIGVIEAHFSTNEWVTYQVILNNWNFSGITYGTTTIDGNIQPKVDSNCRNGREKFDQIYEVERMRVGNNNQAANYLNNLKEFLYKQMEDEKTYLKCE